MIEYVMGKRGEKVPSIKLLNFSTNIHFSALSFTNQGLTEIYVYYEIIEIFIIYQLDRSLSNRPRFDLKVNDIYLIFHKN